MFAVEPAEEKLQPRRFHLHLSRVFPFSSSGSSRFLFQLQVSVFSPLFSVSTAFTFFDPNDPACLEILLDPRTTIPELFAIVRQWVPQVQHKIDIIGKEVRTRRNSSCLLSEI